MDVIKHPYNFQLVPVRQICVDELYQRDRHNEIITEIVNNFDYHKVNPIKCVFREGLYFAFDGQHTTLGLIMKFGEDYLAPVMIYDDITSWEDEAKLFEEINSTKFRKAVSVAESWKSRVNRGEEHATDMKTILNQHGLFIPTKTKKSGNGVVSALTALENTYNDLGAKLFEESLDIISSAWGGDKDSLSAPILRGMAKFVKTYYGEYNKANLIRRLHNSGAQKIIFAGKASNETGVNKYAREILAVYNKQTTTGRLTDKL